MQLFNKKVLTISYQSLPQSVVSRWEITENLLPNQFLYKKIFFNWNRKNIKERKNGLHSDTNFMKKKFQILHVEPGPALESERIYVVLNVDLTVKFFISFVWGKI